MAIGDIGGAVGGALGGGGIGGMGLGEVGGTVVGAVVSGGSSLFNRQIKWKLYDVDHGATIEGQFGPIGLTRDLGSNVGEFSSLNRQDPVIQWLSGAGESYTFDAMMFAADSFSSIQPQIRAMENLVKRDPDLRRPPVCRFTYGTEISAMVIVENLGGIRYGEARIFGGMLRSAMLTITLRKYVPYSPAEEEQTAEAPTETYYRPAKLGDTHEIVAKQRYGAAIKGVNLRARFPSLDISITPGEVVPVLEPQHQDILAATAPASDVFRGLRRSPRVLGDMLIARGGTFVSTVQRA